MYAADCYKVGDIVLDLRRHGGIGKKKKKEKEKRLVLSCCQKTHAAAQRLAAAEIG